MKKHNTIQWYLLCMSAMFILGFTSCANLPEAQKIATTCLPVPGEKQQKYRITLKQGDTAPKVQYMLINQWLAGGLTSAGVSPVGVKLYFSTWQANALKIEKNPAYRTIDFQSVLQGVLLAAPLTEVNNHCGLTEKQTAKHKQVLVGNKVMFTYYPSEGDQQHFLIHKNNNHVLFEKI